MTKKPKISYDLQAELEAVVLKALRSRNTNTMQYSLILELREVLNNHVTIVVPK